MPDVEIPDMLLRIVNQRPDPLPGDPNHFKVEQLAAVYADGTVSINWPLVEELAADPLPPKSAGGLSANRALAVLLMAARQGVLL